MSRSPCKKVTDREMVRIQVKHVPALGLKKRIKFSEHNYPDGHKEGWAPKSWCFQIVMLEKTLESPLDTRRSNQSILKEINPEYSLEGPWYWERLRARGEGGDRGWNGWMASLTQWTWFEQSPGDSEGQGSLACCRPWGHKELDTT